MFIEGETFDDLLRDSIAEILKTGQRIKPSKGPATEIIGACLKLHNPRARFSRTESRATLFSALGETLWYLSGSDDFGFISYYIRRYRELCETPPDIARSEAAYGPRLKEQAGFILAAVRNNDTRKAVISIYSASDHSNKYDVPCTCTLQFFPRSGKLHALAHMRSNDVYIGMAHDIFAFTFLQEYLARTAGLEVGSYVHQVGSLHLYDDDRTKAVRYVESGIADTIPMDPMPVGDPRPALNWLLKAEAALRAGTEVPEFSSIDPYWQDLMRLLLLKKLDDARDYASMRTLMSEMDSNVFRTFIQDKIVNNEHEHAKA